MALLCSILSWMDYEKIHVSWVVNKKPKMLYLSRTHNQLSNVISDFKRISLGGNVMAKDRYSISTLGSYKAMKLD